MKKSVGGAYVYNLVIVFLLIAFGFLMASISYSKAYRVSKGVTSIIESYSGYAGTNSVTQNKIDMYLQSMGYNRIEMKKSDCPKKKNTEGKNATAWTKSGICIYQIDTQTYKDSDGKTKTRYVSYGVVSYMSIDLPLIQLIRIPIYGETEKIYVFN